MAVTQTDIQVNALRELLMARAAYHRALNEFMGTMPSKVRDDRVVHLVQHLPDIDPRETDEAALKQVLNLAYGEIAAEALSLENVGNAEPPLRVFTKAIRQRVYDLVVDKCRHECTDALSARLYIMKKHPEWVDHDGPVAGYHLVQYLDTLNFHAIRENSRSLAAVVN